MNAFLLKWLNYSLFCASKVNLELFNKQLISRFERKVEKLVEIRNTAKWKMQAMIIAKLINSALHNLTCPKIIHQYNIKPLTTVISYYTVLINI